MTSFLLDIVLPALIGSLLGEIPPIKRFFDRIRNYIKRTVKNALDYNASR